MLRALAIAILFGLGACHGPSDTYGTSDVHTMQAWEKPAAPAGVTGADVDYVVDGETFQGYRAMPPDGMEVKGSLLVAHAYLGLSDTEKARAEQFAGMGYVAFAGDFYGKGVRCSDGNGTCGREMIAMSLSNETRFKQIISGATDALLALPGADASKLVGLGYCFGGGIMLELARYPQVGASLGVTFAAVSAIHTTISPFFVAAENSSILTDVQIHHAEWETNGDTALLGLEEELRNGVEGTGAVWETIKYSNVPHGWTFPTSYPRQAIQVHDSSEVFFQLSLGIIDSSEYSLPPLCPAAAAAGSNPWVWVAGAALMLNVALIVFICSSSGGSSSQGSSEIDLATTKLTEAA